MAKQTPMFGLIKNQHIPTWGTIALAALQIALLSGVALLPFFEAGIKAFDAYSQLHNTFSLKLLQAIHHRSSDVFLITTFLHVTDYLSVAKLKEYRFRNWLNWTLLGVLSILVALSGFLAIGSKDSLAAQRILESILQLIPLVGREVALFFLGFDAGTQTNTLVYTHHISTLSILVVFFVYIHIRRFIVAPEDLIYTFVAIVIIGLILPGSPGLPPDAFVDSVWGPWYFIGLQKWLILLPVHFVLFLYPVLAIGVFVLLPYEQLHPAWLLRVFYSLIGAYLLVSVYALFDMYEAFG
jgi:hypothetical protein